MQRYSRNIMTIGAEGQEKLRSGKVLTVGCGALGSQAAMILAGAGVGTLGIMDFDTIDISNLQRQLFFSEEDCGVLKTTVLANKIRALNSEVGLEVREGLLTAKNAQQIMGRYDFIIDATDNPASKILIEKEARKAGVALCTGGVAGWRGEVTTVIAGSAGLRDIFPEMSPDCGLTPCSVEGVMAPATVAVASVQAAEAIKHLTGEGQLLKDRVLVIDMARNIYQIITL